MNKCRKNTITSINRAKGIEAISSCFNQIINPNLIRHQINACNLNIPNISESIKEIWLTFLYECWSKRCNLFHAEMKKSCNNQNTGDSSISHPHNQNLWERDSSESFFQFLLRLKIYKTNYEGYHVRSAANLLQKKGRPKSGSSFGRWNYEGMEAKWKKKKKKRFFSFRCKVRNGFFSVS